MAGAAALGLLVASLGSTGCGEGVRPGDLGDSTFVAVMADLRRAVQPGGAVALRGDSVGRQLARDSIMRSYHVTSVEIESTASHLVDRPGRAADILRAIDRKVLSPPPRPPQPSSKPAS